MKYYEISPNLNFLADLVVLEFESPEMTWQPQGGDSSHEIDSMYIKVYSDDMVLIFSKFVGSATEYQFTDSEWASILEETDEIVYWCIVGYQNTYTKPLNNPDAAPSETYQTGPYYSELRKIILPSPTVISLTSNISNELISEGEYHWYEFKATSYGIYYFETSGNTDTFGEIFHNIVPGQYYDSRVKYDNDSGENYNFKFSITMYAGQTIYIRVRGDNWD